ncbi:LOW QUALITY PROTEIN: uncharacterized protein LOC105429377 [Pogonomyrmex barbatus]|uniref:LOW QUALITY PROTEIN: uncharacterized protein LOC105429377 n=1 Tax=Pogonomyrmex barbatus TaxID=144034 RepID=A0A6I9WDS0_9HYME|nr:LOW QUALITY PROTEIN: uncharacterized protein LOC105429377 [Pogonomyrmex barbatus]
MAIEHKDLLALKENKLCENNCMINKQFKLKRCEHLSFPQIILSVFLVYWFIFCPLIWAVSYTFTYWSSYGSFLFWMIAFLIWIIIMCGLTIFWIYFKARQSFEINAISKYGLNNMKKPLTIHQMSSEDQKFFEMKKWHNSLDSESKENLEKASPLLVHKQIFGKNIEDTFGVMHIEDEETRLSTASAYVKKNPLQDYLNLTTVLPSEDEVKSPKTPTELLSPRELFFIDLIREAERAENAKLSEMKTYFFSDEVIKNDNVENVRNIQNEKDFKNAEHKKNIKDVEDAKDEKDGRMNESKRESSYFLADVKNPVGEKMKIFFQVNSKINGKAELIVEKSMGILQSNEANLQETSILSS